MLKVVIIDDEPLVLEGLRLMVSWEEHGFKLVGEASNGEEGLELISQVNPDLVITDMRMPVMDGIALMEKCQQQLQLKAKFVVLSGYSDFSYIKKALALKSLQYLLKPIDSDEIHDMLDALACKILEEQSKEEKMQQDLRFILEASMKRVLMGDDKSSIIGRIHFILNSSNKANWQYARLYIYNLYTLSKGEGNETISLVKALCRESKGEAKIEIIETMNDGLGLVIYGECLDIFESEKALKAIVDNVEKKGCHCSIISGELVNELKDLSRSKEATMNLTSALFYGTKNHLYTSKDSIIQHNNESLYLKDSDVVIGCILKGDKTGIRRYYESYFRLFRSQQYLVGEIRAWVMANTRALSEIDGLDHREKECIDLMVAEFRGYLLMTLLEIQEMIITWVLMIEESMTVIEKSPVDQMKDYVLANYDKDVKIKNVASHLGFSPVYLGQLFQKETASKYNDYVFAIRIAQAKELLLYSELKVKEVAISVGYKNPDYFILKFKEHNNISPLEYRKRKVDEARK